MERDKLERDKSLMVASCFTAWQMGSGKGDSFDKYLSGFGLADKKEALTKRQIEIIKEKAHSVSSKIHEAYKAGRFKKQ